MTDEDKNNKDNLPGRSGGAWWKPAVEIFSEISTWIAVPIILALVAGKALDNHFGTKPLLLLICTGLGFLASSFGIVRSVKRYAAKMKKEDKENKK